MTMEISRLGIEVTSTGIREASAALGGLSTSANNADRRVASLTANLGNLMRVSGTTNNNVSGLSSTMALINTAMTSAAANAAALAQALGTSAQGMNALGQASNNASRELQRHSYHGGVVTTTLKAMATAALAYFSVRSVRSLVEQADAWGMMQAKLKLATGSMESAKSIQQDLFNMAQAMRSPLEDMSKLYIRLAPALARMGKSSQDTKDMVEGVALALKLGGATGAEAASTMLQFSQAANAGRLNGAEFNAVAENGVMILRALEDHLGKNQAELKKMGADGKLTFDLISEAMAAALPKMREDFKSLPMTFEGAMQRISNAWFKAVGEIGQSEQIGKRLAEAVLKFEEEIPKIVNLLMQTFSFILENGKAITAVFAGLLALGVAKWGLEAVAAFTTVATAVTKAGGAVKLLQVAMSFLGGPIGIISGLLVAGVTAWALWGDSGTTAEDKLTKSTRINVAARIAELNREIEKLEARNTLAGAKKVEESGPKRSGAAKQQMEDIVTLRAKIAGPMDPQARVAAQFKLNALEREYLILVKAENRERELLAEQEEKTRGKNQAAYLKGFDKSFGSDKVRAELAVEEERLKAAAIGLTLTKEQESKIREKFLHAESKSETEAARAIKAANQERDKAAIALDKVNVAYKRLQEVGDSDERLTHGEQVVVELTDRLKESMPAAARSAMVATQAYWQQVAAVERASLGYKEYLKAHEDFGKQQDTDLANAQKELFNINAKIDAYGEAKGAVEGYALAQAEAKLIEMQNPISSDATAAEIEKQRKLIETLQQVAAAKAELGQLDNLDHIGKFFDSAKAADFGNGFANAFGRVGKAIDAAGKSLDQYKKKMVDNANQQARIDKNTNPLTRYILETELRKKELRDTVDMYADMAGAVKGFFKEKTVAYKVFDALETGMRVAQIALAWQENAAKIAAAGEWLVFKAGMMMKSMFMDSVETTASVANSETKAVASTAAGVAKAFEQMGVWGFAGAAAIIAFMASMGVGGGSGGSVPNLAEERQKKQGTGTVLGDDEAKSESIARALDALSENSNIGLVYSSEMAASLRNIDMKMGGLTASIARVNGMTTGKNFGIATGESGKGLFSSKTTTSIQDTGLSLDGTLSDLMGGAGIKQYIDIQKTKKSWYGKTKTSNSREYQGVDGGLTQYIGDIFADISKTIVTAGGQLDYNTDSITSALNEFVIKTDVSLKDLKGEDLEAALNAVFSAAADDMARKVMPTFDEFQRAGEGYFETIIRVSTGIESAKNALAGLGVEMVALNDIANKTGDTDAELVRTALMKAESGTTLEGILKLIDGSMDELIDQYRTLVTVRNQMEGTGMGTALSLNLIRGAGGIAGLADAFDEYLSGFFTDAEQNKIAMSGLRKEFSRLGLELPASKEAFKAMVQSLMAAGPASEELAGRVLGMSGAFAEAMEASEELTKQLVSDAKDALSDAYDKEAEALENVKDKMLGFSEALKEFRSGLILGDMSTKSEMEKYQTALAQYNDVSTRAKAGDEKALEQYTKVADELLQLSQSVFASGGNYTADYERVLAESAVLEEFTSMQADTATQQLDALKRQVEVLIDLDESVKTVAQAIADLAALPNLATTTTATGAAVAVIDPTTATVPTVNTAATSATTAATAQKTNDELLAELKALRNEVATLRAEQQRQTESIVDSNLVGPEEAAKTLVEFARNNASTSNYQPWTPLV